MSLLQTVSALEGSSEFGFWDLSGLSGSGVPRRVEVLPELLLGFNGFCQSLGLVRLKRFRV